MGSETSPQASLPAHSAIGFRKGFMQSASSSGHCLIATLPGETLADVFSPWPPTILCWPIRKWNFGKPISHDLPCCGRERRMSQEQSPRSSDNIDFHDCTLSHRYFQPSPVPQLSRMFILFAGHISHNQPRQYPHCQNKATRNCLGAYDVRFLFSIIL